MGNILRTNLYVNDTRAGELLFDSQKQQYIVEYYPQYTNEPVSFTMPKERAPYCYDFLPPFFEGLLPEGPQLEWALEHCGGEGEPRFQILQQAGRDTVGNVQVGDNELLKSEQLASYENLNGINPVIEGAQEELRFFGARAACHSLLPGVQPKLQARYLTEEKKFVAVVHDGSHIVKPQHPDFEQLPENEHLCMRLACHCKLNVADNFLAVASDKQYVYITKRFDRVSHQAAIHTEDFCQLSSLPTKNKYDSSIEKCVRLIKEYSTDPPKDLKDFYMRVLFSFLIGNSDMHLKNYSMQSIGSDKRLAPVYDMLSTVLALPSDTSETALPLGGKQRKISRKLLLDYLGCERIGLNKNEAETIIRSLISDLKESLSIVRQSNLTRENQERLKSIIHTKAAILD